VNIPQDEANEKSGAAVVALTIVAMATIPAAFWASIAWLVWGWMPAIIVASVALFGSIFVMVLVRSRREIEIPRPPSLNEIEPAHLAPSVAMLQQAA
jgi:hypothetical protein